MHIDHAIESKPCFQIFFCHRYTFRPEVKARHLTRGGFIDSNCANFKTIEKPVTIYVTKLNTGHHTIPLNIVDSVGIELAGDDGCIDVLGFFFFQKFSDLFWQGFVHLA